MSSTQYITDATTRHQVFLQRYAGGESKKALKGLNRLRHEIIARLSQEPTEFQRARLDAMYADINGLYSEFTTRNTAFVMASMHDLSVDESEFSVGLYNKATSASFALPSAVVLADAVETVPISMGAMSIREELERYGKKKAAQTTQIIRDGVALGDTVPVVSKKVGTVIQTLQRRQLDTLIRTAANSISSEARSQVYQNNSDILDGYKWLATLDNRTTLICASRDQEVYQEGIGPKPPAHYGCRSTTIPVVKPEYSLAAGMKRARPSVGTTGAKRVGANVSYGGWLKKQPVEFIDEALGVERSRLFRSGKLSIDKFVDPTGRVYTLNQLKSMNPFVFQEI